jgi:hypothetical protein
VKRGGIFGTTECGKSTLAHYLSWEYYRQKKIRSLVFDTHLEHWGSHAYVTADEEEFMRMVWARMGDLVVMEDASLTINRRQDLKPMFTTIRHQEHRLLVLGHGGSDLLPTMRKQFDTVYLFQQDEDSVKDWKKIFPRAGVEASLLLDQYEFLHVQAFKPSQKMRLTL